MRNAAHRRLRNIHPPPLPPSPPPSFRSKRGVIPAPPEQKRLRRKPPPFPVFREKTPEEEEWTAEKDASKLYRPRVSVYERKIPQRDINVQRKAGKLAPMAKAHYLAEEILTTERTYVNGLAILTKAILLRINTYKDLGRPLMSPRDVIDCFLNVEEIHSLHEQLLAELEQLHCSKQLLSAKLGAVFRKWTPFFKVYNAYVGQYAEASRKLAELRKSNTELAFFLDLTERCENQKVLDLIILPVQRIPRYVMLIKNIIKALSASMSRSGMAQSLRQSFAEVEQMLGSINNNISQQESRNRVVVIQNHLEKVDGQTLSLVSPNRRHIFDGPLVKLYSKHTRRFSRGTRYWFFLFNDMLMYTTIPKSNGRCKPKYVLPFDTMTVHDVPDEGGHDCNIIELAGSTKQITLQADSESEKNKWLRLLQGSVVDHQEKIATLRRGITRPASTKRGFDGLLQ